MVNIWNAYQCMVTFNMSRSASCYESGIGRGMGFRDSNQDLVGFVHIVPERARQRILDIAATQLPSGGAYHQYQPLTKRGNNDIGSGFNDDPLWLILASPPISRRPGTTRFSMSRCRMTTLRALRPRSTSTSSGLALHARTSRTARAAADRSCGLERLPQSELLLRDTRRVVPDHGEQGRRGRRVGLHRRTVRSGREGTGRRSARHRRNSPKAKGYRDAAEKDGGTVAEHGWDGAWFRRAYDFYGKVVGSSENVEGQIYIEPQGMCIMGGVGLEDGRAITALAACANDWRPSTASSFSSRRSPGTTWNSARSPRIRRATRRTPGSSATPIRGS